MAKPKTKGNPIQVRLPLDVDASVRAKALKQETSPAAVVERIIVGAHRKVAPLAGPSQPLTDLYDLQSANPACAHPKSKTLTSSVGLTRCACGAVRGVDGTWR
jgi:hypothetical protein